jgi:hypothetical protein
MQGHPEPEGTIMTDTTRIAELDQVIAETLAIYPELADLPADYVPTESDHWSVRLLCEMREELAELEEGPEECEWSNHPAAELFTRTDNRDGSEIRVCEYHANHADVSYSDPIDA